MKNNLKNPKTLAAIAIVVIAILGGLVFSLNNNDQQTAGKSKAGTTKQETADSTDQNDQDGQVAAAETAALAADTTTVDTNMAASPKKAAPAVQTASAAQPTPTQTTPATVPAPETPTEEQAPEEIPCIIDGTIAVPVGGISCSITIQTQDGSIAEWNLPTFASTVDGSVVSGDLNAPIQIVIESESLAGPNELFTARTITFHYVASDDATPGQYFNLTRDLGFTIHADDPFTPAGFYANMLTVVDNAVVVGDPLVFVPSMY